MNCKEKTIQFAADIVDIRWDRIWLYMDVHLCLEDKAAGAESPAFYFVDEKQEAKAYLQICSREQDLYTLRINITNCGNARVLQGGTYFLYVSLQDAGGMYAHISSDIVAQLDSYSRNFLYKNRSEVYAISFFVPDEAEEILFCMHILDSGKKKKESMGKRAKRYAKRSVKSCSMWLYRMYRKFRVKKKTCVLFLSEQNAVISTNLRAVYERMYARGMDQEFTIRTSFRSSAGKKKRNLIEGNRLLVKLAKADIIIVDDHVPFLDWFQLDKKTKLIQIWHGGLGFKASGYSRWGHKGCPAPMSCHRQYTYGIAGSENLIPVFSEVWGIDGARVLPTGMPRLDAYLDEENRKQVTKSLYVSYPLCKGKKVILFAPTYRGKNKKDAHYPYELIDFEKLYEFCKDEYVVLFKMHPWVSAPVPIPEGLQDRLLDASAYPDINQLFYITDILVTDYSSNIYEYSLMKKPMLFFAFDEIQYSFSRGFHRPYKESAPGKICYSFSELLDAIKKQDFELDKVLEYVEQNFKYTDGHSSDRLIDWLILGNMPEEYLERIQKEAKKQEQLKHVSVSARGMMEN